MPTPTDNPISDKNADRLRRQGPARDFVDHVLRLDVSQGVVVGVLGPWGSGKTSFINLARDRFTARDIPILDFNPWMFSGTAELLDTFFIEVAAQLRQKGVDRAGIADAFNDYGDAFSGMGWVPLVGPWVERFRGGAKVVAKLLARRQEGVAGRREKLTAALRELQQPIVVVLDDIDRLSTAEIRDIFKLVRLTASFPNIIYVVAFDRHRVEHALREDEIPGRDYLEKILQLAVDLPVVPDSTLGLEIGRALDEMLDDIPETGPFDEQLWPDVFVEVVRPLIRQMRDTRRYVTATDGTIRSTGSRIALADLLGLEAIRVFLPDVFALLPRAVGALTEPSSPSYGSRGGADDERKKRIAELIAAAGDRTAVAEAMVKRLFPAGSRHLPGGIHYGRDVQASWLRERRVAHPGILELYLSRVAGEALDAHMRAESLFGLIRDERAFGEALAAVELDERESAISALESFEEEYVPGYAVPGARVLLNALDDLPERERGMLSFGPDIVVARVVVRLLRTIDDEDAREQAVEEILAGIASLSSRLELLDWVGHRDGVGNKSVSVQTAARLEADWRAQVRVASPAALADERQALRVLAVARRDQGAGEPDLAVPDDVQLTHALLRGALTFTRSQALGSRAVRREPRLHWDTLVALFDGEGTLKRRVDELRASSEAVRPDLLELYDKYASGWRPERFH